MSAERFITNGTTAVPFYGTVIPRGCREITATEYVQHLAAAERASLAAIEESVRAAQALRASAVAKLVAGEPLTPEEAELIVR